MRRYAFWALLVVAVLLVFTGCAAPAPPTEPAAPPTEPSSIIPEEPPGRYAQPNPLWGIGIKPDGTRYEFSHAFYGYMNEWAILSELITESLFSRAAANCTTYNPALNATRQMGIVEDITTLGSDGLLIAPLDSAGVAPAVDKCLAAGIPVFAYDMAIYSETPTTFFVSVDQFEMGRVTGQYLVDWANENGQDLYVYELWGDMAMEGSQRRHDGLRSATDNQPRIKEVIESPDLKWLEATDDILDAFTTHPNLNAIMSQGDYEPSVIAALDTLGRLYPKGHPEHVVVAVADAHVTGREPIREGYIDGAATHSSWELCDAAVKAALLYVCLGEPIPDEVTLPTVWYTWETYDVNPFGMPKAWQNMWLEEPFVDKWPLLDLEQWGIPTPTLDMS